MSPVRVMGALLAALVFVVARPVGAADHTLLIQSAASGKYTVWHSEGEPNFSDDELSALEVSATPEGSAPMLTAAGGARAFETPEGIVIRVGGEAGRAVLIDRDACGGVRLWHSEGATRLGEDQLTELVLAAVPGGGKRLLIAGLHAKAYLTRIGVIAVMWPPQRRP